MNVDVANNIIENDSSASASYNGIYMGAGTMARANRLTLVKGNAAIATQNSSLAAQNLITGSRSGPTYGIRAVGGSTGIVAEYNYATGTFGSAAFSNSGGGGNPNFSATTNLVL